jgi:hypothetical protein
MVLCKKMQQCLVCEGEARYKEQEAARYFCGTECQAMHHQLIGIFGDEYETGYGGLQKYNLMYFDPTTLANMAFTSRRVRALIDPTFLEQYTNTKGAAAIFDALDNTANSGNARVVQFWVDWAVQHGWPHPERLLKIAVRENYNDIVNVIGPYYRYGELIYEYRDREILNGGDARQLTRLPEAIGRISNLQRLELFENRLTELPESIGDLSRLVVLDLSHNRLTRLPESIGNLSNLVTLDLDHNLLAELPEAISNLSSLLYLDLRDNPLTELPESFSRLSSLKELDVRGTRIVYQSIPRNLRRITKHGPF